MFDLNVTRYTNSQNPVNERDFHSNDDVQKKIQNDFFKFSNIWFETRRSEFSSKPLGIKIVTNELLGQRYLCYFLEEPFKAKSKKALIFLSKKFNKNGLYEQIFNRDTNYKDLLAAYYLFEFIEKKRKDLQKKFNKYNFDNPLTSEDKLYRVINYATFDILALFRYIFIKIYSNKLSMVTNRVIDDYERNKFNRIEIIYDYIVDKLGDFFSDEKDNELVFSVYFKKAESYSEMKKYIKKNIKHRDKKILECFLN